MHVTNTSDRAYVADRGGVASVHSWWIFWGSAFLYFFLILFPVLMADRYLNDDLVRALEGNFGWNHNGRPLTNLVMRVLELGGERLVDISPVPQLFAVAVLALIGVLVARRFGLRSWWVAALVSLPLGAQPFFLENISYRFDAVCMALAILFAVLPMLSKDNGWKTWALGAMSVLATLCLYQPAVTVFLIFALLEASLALMRSDTSTRLVVTALSRRLVQVLLAMLMYKLAFERSIEGWVREHGEVAPFARWLDVAVENGLQFAQFVGSAFSPRWLVFCSLALLATFLMPVIAIFSVRRSFPPKSVSRPGALRVSLEALVWVMAIPCVVGPMLLLEDPVLMPRVLVGVGALLAALLIRAQAVVEHRGWRMAWPAGLAVAWALFMAVAAAAYSNAASAQRQYEHAIASRLADDLAELQAERSIDGYALAGSAGLAPVAEHVRKNFPLIEWLVLPYLRAGDYHTRNFLKHFPGMSSIPHRDAVGTGVSGLSKCSDHVHRIRAAYRICLIAEVAVVEFNVSTSRLER